MEDTVFSAIELRLLISVLRQACADIGPIDDEVKSKMANRILSMACDGERDFEILRRQAISGFAQRR